MADLGIQIETARREGHSDSDILDYLGGKQGLTDKIGEARKSGYGDAEILAHLSRARPAETPGIVQRVGSQLAAGPIGAGLIGAGRILAPETTDAIETGINNTMNWLGTQATKTATGALTTGRTAADLLDQGKNWAGDKIGGPVGDAIKSSPTPFLPPGLGEVRQMAPGVYDFVNPTAQDLDKAIFKVAPEVDDPGGVLGRSAPFVNAGVRGAMGAVALPGGGMRAAFPGFTGGLFSEVGGEAAKGTEYEVPARLVGAGLGAGLGGLGQMTAETLGRIGAAALRPATRSGRETIIGQTLREMSLDPAAAVAGIEAPGMTIPGVATTAAKVSGDPGLLALESAVFGGAGKGGLLQSIMERNNAARTQYLNDLSPGALKDFVGRVGATDADLGRKVQAAIDALPPTASTAQVGDTIRGVLQGNLDKLTKYRSDVADPLYTASRDAGSRIDARGVLGLIDDKLTDAAGNVRMELQRVRRDMIDAKGDPRATVAALQKSRFALDDRISAARKAGASNLERELMEVRGTLDNALASEPLYGVANDAYRTLSEPITRGFGDELAPRVAGTLEREGFTGRYTMPLDVVPQQFFGPGAKGAATMKEWLRANGNNPEGLEAMRQHIATQAREALGDSTNVTKLSNFLMKNKPALDAFDPALYDQLRTAAARGGEREAFGSSAAGTFLKDNPADAIRKTLSAADSERRVADMVRAAGDDAGALEGLRRGVLDDFRNAAKSSVREDAAGTPQLMANPAATWLDANRTAAAKVLTKDQMAALDLIVSSMKTDARTATGSVGSNTYQKMATGSVLARLLPRGTDASPLGKPVNWAVTKLYDNLDQVMLDRLMEVLADPPTAAMLMKRASPGNVKLAESYLKRLPVAGAASLLRGSDRGPE